MKTAVVTIKGISLVQFGRYHQTEKKEKESHDDYEKRTWRERCHTNLDGFVFIPPMAFKKSLEIAASFLNISIPGEGKSKYNRHFVAGVLVSDPLVLDVKKEDVEGVWVFGNSMGRRGGSGPRVAKCFPTVHKWGGDVTYYILDDTITKEVFERVIVESGNFIGIGVFRPANGGYHGRFKVIGVKWL